MRVLVTGGAGYIGSVVAAQLVEAGRAADDKVRVGDAAAEIVRVAKEREVDLILISSHGRTGLGRILFGSTAEAVVRHASCPVLVVKPPQEEEAAN